MYDRLSFSMGSYCSSYFFTRFMRSARPSSSERPAKSGLCRTLFLKFVSRTSGSSQMISMKTTRYFRPFMREWSMISVRLSSVVLVASKIATSPPSSRNWKVSFRARTAACVRAAIAALFWVSKKSARPDSTAPSRSRLYFPTLKVLVRIFCHFKKPSVLRLMNDFPRPGRPTNTRQRPRTCCVSSFRVVKPSQWMAPSRAVRWLPW
mmetsp:Transcript_45462/g.134545  ORF Transcript_45462/g.134545 Transcript_45462/m.134545 type:complete len:207 (-) Transcript_45462:639-1259(-)